MADAREVIAAYPVPCQGPNSVGGKAREVVAEVAVLTNGQRRVHCGNLKENGTCTMAGAAGKYCFRIQDGERSAPI